MGATGSGSQKAKFSGRACASFTSSAEACRRYLEVLIREKQAR